ncbi:hypothetical protein SRHO_G00304700 [Serrasalmus rhombeus]
MSSHTHSHSHSGFPAAASRQNTRAYQPKTSESARHGEARRAETSLTDRRADAEELPGPVQKFGHPRAHHVLLIENASKRLGASRTRPASVSQRWVFGASENAVTWFELAARGIKARRTAAEFIRVALTRHWAKRVSCGGESGGEEPGSERGGLGCPVAVALSDGSGDTGRQ